MTRRPKRVTRPGKKARILLRQLAKMQKPISTTQLACVSLELTAKLREFVDIYEKLSLLICAADKNGTEPKKHESVSLRAN